MIAEDDQNTQLSNLQSLLKKTQKLPAAKSISEDEIAAEIDAYLASQ